MRLLSCLSGRQNLPFLHGLPERMMGLEPTTFCMANRPSAVRVMQKPAWLSRLESIASGYICLFGDKVWDKVCRLIWQRPLYLARPTWAGPHDLGGIEHRTVRPSVFERRSPVPCRADSHSECGGLENRYRPLGPSRVRIPPPPPPRYRRSATMRIRLFHASAI